MAVDQNMNKTSMKHVQQHFLSYFEKIAHMSVV